MDGFKNFFSSRTVISQIVGVLAGMLTIYGVDLDAETQNLVVTLIFTLQGIAGAYFRYVASKQLTVGSS